MKLNLRNLNYLFLTSLVSLALISCSDDSSIDSATNYEYNVSATIKPMSGFSNTDNILSGIWTVDDKLALMDISSSKSKVVLKNKSFGDTSFSSSSTSLSYDGNNVSVFYPASALEMSSSDTLIQVLNINGQDGTLAGSMKHLYASDTTTITVNDNAGNLSVTLSPIMALANIELSYNGEPIKGINKISITDANCNFYSACKFDLKKNTLKDGINYNMTIQNEKGLDGNAIIAVFPAANLNLNFIVNTAKGETYQLTSKEPINFTAGETTTIDNLTCTPISSKAHVGDYFYDDNTWSTDLIENKKCIGVIYTLCDMNGNPSMLLNESTSGRVVSLKDVSSSTYSWSTAGETIEGCDSIQTADGTNASITIETDKNYTSGAASLFNELPNTARLVSYYYGANKSCYDFAVGTRGAGSWKLPAAGDMTLIYQMYKSSQFDSYANFKSFQLGAYWTSTIYNDNKIWALNFHSGTLYANSRVSYYYVRPITSF